MYKVKISLFLYFILIILTFIIRNNFSEWGHGFRKDYLKLNLLRTRYPDVPIMALTATATIQVPADIVKHLNLRDCKWFLNSIDRPNLQYHVERRSSINPKKEIEEFILNEFPQASGIVYLSTRDESKNLAKHLRQVRKHLLL